MFETKADLFEPRMVRLATLAKALSHPARLSLLEVLAAHDTCICGDLVDELPLAQASVSRHLKTLKDAGLIKGEIDGPRTCYCLDREAVASLFSELRPFFEKLLATPSYEDCC
jgi:ArsR family transcriptional regulator